MRIISEMYQLTAFPVVKNRLIVVSNNRPISKFARRAHRPQHFVYAPGREMTAEATLQIAGDTPILELGHLEGLTLVGLVRVIPARHRLIMIPKHLISILGIISGCVRRHNLQFSALFMCPSMFNRTMFDVGECIRFCRILYTVIYSGTVLLTFWQLAHERGAGGNRGRSQIIRRQGAWSSTNRSILSGYILREAYTKRGKGLSRFNITLRRESSNRRNGATSHKTDMVWALSLAYPRVEGEEFLYSPWWLPPGSVPEFKNVARLLAVEAGVFVVRPMLEVITRNKETGQNKIFFLPDLFFIKKGIGNFYNKLCNWYDQRDIQN